MENDITVVWSMKAKKSFRERVSKVAKTLDRSASQLIREATDKEINRLAKSNPKIAQILEQEAA
jgi:hypothetical protein